MSEAAGTSATAQFYARAAWRYPGLVLGTMLTVPLTVLVNIVLPPLVVSHVLDRLSRHDYTTGHLLASFGTDIVLYVVLMLLGGIVVWRIVDVFAWTLEANVQRDLAQQSFSHLVGESADFHSNAFGGGLVSATTKLLGSYVRIADTTIFQVYPLVISLVSVVVITAGRAPLFAVLLSVCGSAYMVIALFLSRPVRHAGAVHAEVESRQTGALADAITNVMAVKGFGRERHEHARFTTATEATRVTLMRMMRTSQRQNAAFGSITSSISAMAFVVAVFSVVDRSADLGVVFLILNYTTNITQQLFQYSNNALRTYNRAFGDAGAMVGILATTPSVTDPAEPQTARITAGEITFDDVSFSHAGSGVQLFSHFSLAIRPGEKVGLVGHSGAGKTSFVRLLLRFSDVDGGRILIDGQDIASVAQADLRAAIAYVPQEPLLFHRTIEENVAYGRLDAPAADVRHATRRANAAGFVDALPAGYETLVGERGVKLSGGQRQRIAVARAMLKDAPILLLDEATSALDSESEVLIQDALWRLMEGRTAVVIAHRLSTVQRLDRIVVLADGEVAEVGTHDELIARDGTYAAFWAHQSGGTVAV